MCQIEVTTRLIVLRGRPTCADVRCIRHSWAWVAVVASLALPLAGRAQEQPLVPPAPFAPPPAEVSPGRQAMRVAAAQRAHDLGLLSVAAALYREILDTAGADRSVHALALATVLLDAGRAAEAEEVLAALPEPRGAAWRLRVGLAALQLRKRDTAQAQWDAIRLDELPLADRPWYWFLTGALWDTATPRDRTRANDFYTRAENEAPTLLARARFQLAAEQVRLRLGRRLSESDIRQAREGYERFAGRSIGYDYARDYAIMQHEAGNASEAVAFLNQRVLPVLPAQERGWRDEFEFLLGLMDDPRRSGPGRDALGRLLANGTHPERQRQALHLLALASETEPARGQFRNTLTRLLAAQPPHRIRESLLYYRAQLALSEKNFVRAEDDARTLVDEFPGSPLRAHAFGVLTQSAWEQQRYRTAADHATKARAELPPGRVRAELGVLVAEARFRAGLASGVGATEDFRIAADTYAAVLQELPEEIEGRKLGDLMFQRVLAEVKAGSLDAAARVLDSLEGEPRFALENRWQAEWSLARALQVQGKTAEAYARVNQLLVRPRPEAEALPADLRARMAWLQARLSFDAGRFEQTLAAIEPLLASLASVSAPLRTEMASTAVLLRARAELELGREPAALEIFKRLREEHPKSEAAIYSYLIQADHYRAQERIGDAQQLLTALVDNADYRSSVYIPYALFHLALLSERLGQQRNLEEANKRIEQLVNSAAAAGNTDLIFAARLKQGDLLRKMSQFPQAQRAYEDLVNRYPQRPDVVLAHLALAECHNAQSAQAAGSAQSAHADIAQIKFEELRDRVDAPPDVRVEAGYNLGALLARRGRPEEAAKVWMSDVIQPFLLSEKQPIEPGAKRRYWLARTLLELGTLLEQQENLEEARNAYETLYRSKLGHGEETARSALQRLGLSAASLE
jgi:cellulose synthase operon protein C